MTSGARAAGGRESRRAMATATAGSKARGASGRSTCTSLSRIRQSQRGRIDGCRVRENSANAGRSPAPARGADPARRAARQASHPTYPARRRPSAPDAGPPRVSRRASRPRRHRSARRFPPPRAPAHRTSRHGVRIGSIEFRLAMRGLDHAGTAEAEARGRHEAQTSARRGQHRRAAERRAGDDGERRDAGAADVEQRAQRRASASSAALASCSRTPPESTSSTTTSGRSSCARWNTAAMPRRDWRRCCRPGTARPAPSPSRAARRREARANDAVIGSRRDIPIAPHAGWRRRREAARGCRRSASAASRANGSSFEICDTRIGRRPQVDRRSVE